MREKRKVALHFFSKIVNNGGFPDRRAVACSASVPFRTSSNPPGTPFSRIFAEGFRLLSHQEMGFPGFKKRGNLEFPHSPRQRDRSATSSAPIFLLSFVPRKVSAQDRKAVRKGEYPDPARFPPGESIRSPFRPSADGEWSAARFP